MKTKKLLLTICVATFAFAILTVKSNAQCFAPAVNIGVGNNPTGIITADFNNDGKADLAVASYNTPSDVSVALGDGAGGFSYFSSFPLDGNGGAALCSGDFNGDNKPDLAVVNYFSAAISIFLGDGAGSFTTGVGFPSGNNPRSIVCADFNGDNKVDLAVANYGDGNISLFSGDGAGNFATAVNFATGSGPFSILRADLNGDGKLDLATANYDGSTVSILLGNGSGSFSSAVNFVVGTNPISITNADYNGDGKMDLTTANYGTDSVSLLMGNGAGSFTRSDILTGTGPISITSADFNGDSKIDLAVVDNNLAKVSVMAGNGAGGFGAPVDFSAGTHSTQSLCSADFNGDGKADIATADGWNYYALSILINAALAQPGAISGNTGMCSGAVNTYSIAAVPGATSYTWTLPSGWSGTSTSTSISATAGSLGGTISVTANNSCGGSVPQTLIVTAYSSTSASITPNGPTTFCQGDNVTLTASNGSAYLWSNGATTQSINISTAGTYSVTASNSFGCVSSAASTTVTVNSPPIANAGSDVSICSGSSTNLSAGSGTSYSWSPATGLSSAVIANPVANPTTTTNYTVTVTSNGCSATDAVLVTVYSTTSATITPNGSTAICQGDTRTLTASNGSAYLWSNSATTQFINVSAAGTYSVTISNSFGCGPSSASVTITVNPNPAVPVITASGSTTFCIGDSVILTSSSANSYLWNTGSATTQSLNVSTAGSYSVIAYNTFGCGTSSATTVVNVNDPLSDFTGSSSLVFIPNATVTFSAATNGSGTFTYLWNFGDGATSGASAPSHTYSSIGNETVALTVTDNSNGCSKTITKLSYIDVEQLFPSNALSTGTTLDITGLAFQDDLNGIFTLTDGNCIFTNDGGITWTPLLTGNSEPLTGASYFSGNWFLTGSNGTIMNSIDNGLTWNTYITGTFEQFLASAFSSLTNGFAVGTNGIIQQFNGSTWVPQLSGISGILNSVETFSNGNAIAVGNNQTILYYNGSSWAPQTSPINFLANAVKFSSALSGYVVGSNGVIIKTIDGGLNWTPSLTGVDIDFKSVTVSGPDSAWATGTGGIIYSTIDNGLNWVRYSVGNAITQTGIKVTNGRGFVTGLAGNAKTFGNGVIPLNTTAIEKAIADFKVYPNPASNKAIISALFSGPTILIIELKDLNGKHLKTIENSTVSGKYNNEINLDQYSSGTYFIHIREGEKSWVKKLVIVK